MKKLLGLCMLMVCASASADCTAPNGYTNRVENGVVVLPHLYHRGNVYYTTMVSNDKDDNGHRIWTIDNMNLTCGFSSSTLSSDGIDISLFSYNGGVFTVRLAHNDKGFTVETINKAY